jgi:hypothetical protein
MNMDLNSQISKLLTADQDKEASACPCRMSHIQIDAWIKCAAGDAVFVHRNSENLTEARFKRQNLQI